MSGWSKVADGDIEERERRGGGASSRDVAGSVGAESMTLRVWRYGPGHEMAYHRHGNQEEVYRSVSGGPQEVMVEGEVVAVQDGDWLRFAKDTAAPHPEPQRPRGRLAHDRRARPAPASPTASGSTPRPARRSRARDPPAAG